MTEDELAEKMAMMRASRRVGKGHRRRLVRAQEPQRKQAYWDRRGATVKDNYNLVKRLKLMDLEFVGDTVYIPWEQVYAWDVKNLHNKCKELGIRVRTRMTKDGKERMIRRVE